MYWVVPTGHNSPVLDCKIQTPFKRFLTPEGCFFYKGEKK